MANAAMEIFSLIALLIYRKMGDFKLLVELGRELKKIFNLNKPIYNYYNFFKFKPFNN